MRLFLQIGYGMKGLAVELMRAWSGGTAILSPRDMSQAEIVTFSKQIRDCGGEVAVDPQLYLPKADHGRLTAHPYWPADYDTASFDKSAARHVVEVLVAEYCERIGATRFVVPGRYATQVDDRWRDYNSLYVEESLALNTEVPVYQTLCLSGDAVRVEDQVHRALDYLEDMATAGVYVVLEPPGGSYLVGDPVWVANMLDLCAGLRLQGKDVVVGYANHQDISLAICDVSAIASGTFLNVRRFCPGKFQVSEAEEVSRPAVWYYCPQALSEYQVQYLDMAQKAGILGELHTDAVFGSTYSEALFSGAQPTSVDYREPQAFRHYLQCLARQVANVSRDSYEETRNAVRMTFETASELTQRFRALGVRGRARDFSEAVDASLSALDQFDLLRGMVMRQHWDGRRPGKGPDPAAGPASG